MTWLCPDLADVWFVEHQNENSHALTPLESFDSLLLQVDKTKRTCLVFETSRSPKVKKDWKLFNPEIIKTVVHFASRKHENANRFSPFVKLISEDYWLNKFAVRGFPVEVIEELARVSRLGSLKWIALE